MFKELKSALLIFIALTLLTGIVYPFFVTGIAQLFFNKQANGSLITDNGKVVGSELIGQSFDDPKYFWGRLSATSPVPYNAASSSGSNLGPVNGALRDAVVARIKSLQDADPSNTRPIPVDLVTASGSGLDPHISLAAAYYQTSRIVRARSMPEEVVRKIIQYSILDRWLGIAGEPTVNVLQMNLLLDHWQKNPNISLERPEQDALPKNMKWGGWENPRKL